MIECSRGHLFVKRLEGPIANKPVTYEVHRRMDGATKLKCSEFGDAIVANTA